MMSLTEEQKAIAMECLEEAADHYGSVATIKAKMIWERGINNFLSRIREKQKAVAVLQRGNGQHIECIYKGLMTPIDVSTLMEEDRIDRSTSIKLFTIPPASPYCPRRLDNGGMSSTAVICGNQSSADVLISKIQKSAPACDCKELVEALEYYEMGDDGDKAKEVIAKHKASMGDK